jgi:hypothetical protein
MMGTICYNNKDQLMAGMICAGWDPVEGGTLYAIPLGGACVKMPFAIGGSGSTYIYGHVDEAYRPGMTRAECIDFVQTGEVSGSAVVRWSPIVRCPLSTLLTCTRFLLCCVHSYFARHGS